jgi:hypothetical protein
VADHAAQVGVDEKACDQLGVLFRNRHGAEDVADQLLQHLRMDSDPVGGGKVHFRSPVSQESWSFARRVSRARLPEAG